MSHVAARKANITDLAALARACENMGLEFMEGQTTYRWYKEFKNDYHQEDAAYKQGFKPSDYGKSAHAIRIPGNKKAYEIGVVQNKDSPGFSLLLDFWQGGYGMVEKAGGKGCEGLIQAYAVEAARSTENARALIEQYGCVENLVVDEITGDKFLVYQDEGMTEAEIWQYVLQGS